MNRDRSGRATAGTVSRRATLAAGGVIVTAGCLRLTTEAGGGSGEGDVNADGGGAGDDSESDGGDAGSPGGGRVQVIDTLGVVGPDGGAVSVLGLGVQREGGPVDLGELAVRYTGDTDTAALTHASTGDDAVYYVAPESAADETDTVMSAADDRYVVTVPFGSSAGRHDLAEGDPAAATNVENDLRPPAEGERARVELTTAGGETTEVTLTVPDTLGEAGQPVRL